MGDDTNTSAGGGKPFRTPSKNKSEPAPDVATDGHPAAPASADAANSDYEYDEDTPEDNGGDHDTRAAGNQPRVSPVDGPVLPGPGGMKFTR
jgi:hypothetical protein